ncbi:MAG: VWA domain-containing protein, partial [Ktedonobacteraceae bacterium]
MFKRFQKNRFGYSRWDGTQRIDGLDADDILNALSDDYMEDGNLQQALRRLMQDGMHSEDGRRTMGLRELLDRMRQQRQQQLNRYNMASGVMDDLRQKLEEIKQMEREGIQHRLDGPGQPQSDSQQQPPSLEGEPSQSDSSLTPEQQERLQKLREEYQRNRQAEAEGAQEGQQQSNASQEGQSGQSGEASGDDLTPEQKRRMLEMIAKRKQDFLDQLPK